MVRSTKILATILALGIASMGSKCNFSLFGSPTQTNIEEANARQEASPTPTPKASPISVDSSCSQTCSVDSLKFDEPATFIELGKSQTFNLTPYTKVYVCDVNGKPTSEFKIVKTSASCDEPREQDVEWSVNSNAILMDAYGFKGTFTRKSTGQVTISASLEGKTVSRVVN